MARPFMLVTVALGLIAALLAVSGLVESHRQDFSVARRQVDLAIVQSQERLVDRTRLAAQNSIFVKNLDWGLQHTINQTLAGFLEPSVIDEVHLHDSNCQVRAQAILGSAAGIDCPLRVLSERQWDQPYWFASSGNISMAWTTRINVGNEGIYFLTSLVKLNENWLKTRADLRQLVDRLNLQLVNKSDAKGLFAVTQIGKLNQGAHAFLISRDNSVNMFPVLFDPNRDYVNGYIWLAWLLAIVGLIYIWWKQAANLASQNQKRKHLLNWSQKMAAQPKSDQQELPLLNVDDDDLCAYFNEIANKLKTTEIDLRKSQAEMNLQRLKLADREEQLADLHRQMADLAELESFAIQFRGTSGRFLGRITKLAEHVDRSITSLSQEIGGHTRNLRAFMKGWQHQIETRGARRFFRHLSEAIAEDGRSQLDHHLQNMEQICQQISRETESLLQQSQSIKEGVQSALILSGHWHGLALRETNSPLVQSLLESALTAQDLYRSGNQEIPFRFVNVMGLVYQGSLPAIPQVVLTSAIYHLIEALSACAQDSKFEDELIRMQVVQKEGHAYVLIGADEPKQFEPVAEHLISDSHHYKMAKQLMSPCQVQVHPFKTSDHQIVFGIHWLTEHNQSHHESLHSRTVPADKEAPL